MELKKGMAIRATIAGKAPILDFWSTAAGMARVKAMAFMNLLNGTV